MGGNMGSDMGGATTGQSLLACLSSVICGSRNVLCVILHVSSVYYEVR